MPIVLTWNLYHGAIAGGTTPMQRLANIATLCQNNNVDIICLQEVPQANLDATQNIGHPAVGAGVTQSLNAVANFLNNYTVVQAYRETNPSNGPQFANTTDGYLTIFRNATYPGGAANPGYYRAAAFKNLYGAFLRPPFSVELTSGGHTTQVLNWHANSDAASAGWALEILDAQLGSANNYHDPVVVAGDFNVRGDFSSVFGQQQNFDNWDNLVANYDGPSGKTILGLDHILTSRNCNSVLGGQLQFTSDAYHFPLAAQY